MRQIQNTCENVAKMLAERGFAIPTIDKYWRHWNKLLIYMSKNDLESYDAKVGLSFLSDIFGITVFTGLDREKKWAIRSVQHLNNYLEFGVIFPTSPKISTTASLERYGELFDTFKRHQTEMHNISSKTLLSYDKYIGKFLLCLEKQGIKNPSDITAQDILGFCKVIACQSDGVAHNMSCAVRVFLRYLNARGIHRDDLSSKVSSFIYRRKSRLPSVLTDYEKKALIDSIDRTSKIGKRDYAIILIASRLGLRSGDIRSLRFDEIHWGNNTVEIVMHKTGKPLVLPLLIDVGDAIIDYIKYARPITDSPVIFQTCNAPVTPISAGAMSSIVKSYAGKAGIDTMPGRHFGPHLMRNTLASALLNENVPLPEISGILGHSTTRTTQEYYLRIDINSLAQCALETPRFPWEPGEEVF